MELTPLALRIKELRELNSWSQAELSRRSGVAQSQISRLESEQIESVHLPTLERLALALNCPPGFLIEKR